MTEFIVHADDFGYSRSVNACIIDCFRKGWLSETSLMVNMPGCDDAVLLARKNGFDHRVGLHLNLTEGRPLTESIKGLPRFCSADGAFNKVFHVGAMSRFVLTRAETHAVQLEIEAQLQKFMSYRGMMLKIDSHHHAHTDWSIYRLLKPLALKYGFKSMRISADMHSVGVFKAIYKCIFNANVRKFFKTTDHFDGIVDGLLVGPDGTTEVMVHPLMRNGKLCDSRKPFELNIRRVLSVPNGYIQAP